MTCRIEHSELRGTIACPASKSYTHRAAFVASLADGTSTIRNALDSRDTCATLDACRAFGAQIERTEGTLRITGSPEPHAAKIDAQNSGTTIRIAAAIAALADGTTHLTGDASLQTRPVGPLLEALESLGARCESADGTPPLSVGGPIPGGAASVHGGVSSQFVSALLIAGVRMKDGMALSVTDDIVSAPYIDATISVMRHFGARVGERGAHKGYDVEQGPYTASTFDVPSDYSSLALLLAASVLTGDGLAVSFDDGRLPQADAAFLRILESMQVKLESKDGVIRTHSPETLSGGTFDLSDTPDLLPPLSILALKCNGRIDITGIAHARKKETDRIAILAEQLKRLGVGIDEQDDGLSVWTQPDAVAQNAALDAHGDHRLFMALCIACMRVGGSVEGAESVAVSYPRFLEDMRSVGARISE